MEYAGPRAGAGQRQQQVLETAFVVKQLFLVPGDRPETFRVDPFPQAALQNFRRIVPEIEAVPLEDAFEKQPHLGVFQQIVAPWHVHQDIQPGRAKALPYKKTIPCRGGAHPARFSYRYNQTRRSDSNCSVSTGFER